MLDTQEGIWQLLFLYLLIVSGSSYCGLLWFAKWSCAKRQKEEIGYSEGEDQTYPKELNALICRK